MRDLLKRPNVRNLGLSLIFAIGGGLTLSSYLPLSFIAMSSAILVAHEMGHWYSALLRNGDPDLPVVIPLGVVSVGFTRVRNLPKLSSRAKRYVIASGPIAGTLAGIGLLPFALLNGGEFLIFGLLTMIILEVYGGFFGLDGRRWRKERAHYGVT